MWDLPKQQDSWTSVSHELPLDGRIRVLDIAPLSNLASYIAVNYVRMEKKKRNLTTTN